MKLRIRGNSIRLRLLRSEVATLALSGHIEETTAFGPGEGQILKYAIISNAQAEAVSVRFAQQCITISVPASIIKEWASTNRVSIEATQSIDSANELVILVEKDFKCIDREDTDNADAFENPAAVTSGKC